MSMYVLSKVATGRPFSILVPMVGVWPHGPRFHLPSTMPRPSQSCCCEETAVAWYEFPDLSDQVERAPGVFPAASNHITVGILSGKSPRKSAIVVIAVPA